LRRMKPRQLSFAFADSPPGGGKATGSDASERRDFLLHKAKGKKTRGFVAEAADTIRLLEEAASEANLARALLNVAPTKARPAWMDRRSRRSRRKPRRFSPVCAMSC